MDYEAIENFDNFTSDDDDASETSHKHIIRETVFTIICLLAICSNAVMIYIIFRFKNLRTAPNIFLANWAIADLCSLLHSPSGYMLIADICEFTFPLEFLCFLYKGVATLHCTTLVFVFIVILDWFLAAYFQNASKKFRNVATYVIIAIWLLSLVALGTTITFCITEQLLSDMHYEIIASGYTILLLSVISVQCCRAVRKCMRRHTDYPTVMLTLGTVFAACWSLGFLDLLIIFIEGIYYDHLGVVLIGILGVTGSPIVILFVFYYLDADFRTCVLRTLKRQSNTYEEIRFDSPISFEKPICEMANESGQISFNRREAE